jgi:hypothetical protein
MSRTLLLALAIAFLAAEAFAQFALHDQRLTILAAVLGVGALAVRLILGPQTADEWECAADCPKCAESESTGGEDL